VNASLPSIVTATFPGALQNGARGESVRTLQTNLNAIRPFYPVIPALNADGIFGPITQSAVVAFQRTFGMPANGIVNELTWNLLASMRNLMAPPAPRAITPTEETIPVWEEIPTPPPMPPLPTPPPTPPPAHNHGLPAHFEHAAFLLAWWLMTK